MRKLTIITLLINVFFFSCSQEEFPQASLEGQNKNGIALPQVENDYAQRFEIEKESWYETYAKAFPKEGRSLICQPEDGIDVFVLQYFPSLETLCFDEKELAAALVFYGMSVEDAVERAYTIFHTAYATSQMIGETAGFISPIIAIPGNEYVTGRISSFLDDGQCLEGCLPDPDQGETPIPIPNDDPYMPCPDVEIDQALTLIGRSGGWSPTASDDANAWAILHSTCDPDFSALVNFSLEDIEDILAEVMWNRYVSGELTERQFWDLYQHFIVPRLLLSGSYVSQNPIDVGSPCLIMTMAFLRISDPGSAYSNLGYAITGKAGIFCGLPQED